MPTVKFNLNNASAKKTAIMLIFNYDNKRLKLSTDISVSPKYWNKKTQRVRELMEYSGSPEINEALGDWSRLILKVYNDQLKLGINPEPEQLRTEVQKAYDSPKQTYSSSAFWKSFNEFVQYKKSTLPDIRDYDKSLRKHLQNAEKIYGAPLNIMMLKNLNKGFIETFDHYLTYKAINSQGEKGLTTNSIGKQYKNLKVFLNWCFDREIAPRFNLKHLVTKSEDVDSIYLNESEIQKIMNLKIEDEKKVTVRDLFVVGCETGLRFSDFSRLQSQHIKKDRIEIHQKKTSKKVIVPLCSENIFSILKKYDNQLPQMESVSEFNKTIRELCFDAKIKEEVTVLRKNQNIKQEVVYSKYELVTSHTCRRSFCTNHFLNGMPVNLIMAISGHKTERAFMRYLKIDDNKKIDLFRENMKARKTK